MSGKQRTHIVSDDLSNMKLTPKHLTKQQFARRLYQLMLSKGWSQSEFARQAGLQRDSISTYIRGVVMPTAQNVKAMADALGMSPEDLMPNHIESAIDADNPELEIKVSPVAPSMAWLRVNRMVPLDVALQIAQLLGNADAVDAKRSG